MEIDDRDTNCNNVEKFLSLQNTETGPQWKVTTEKNSDLVMKNSVPWKLDAVCNLKRDDRLCYDTLFDNKNITICVQSVSNPHEKVETGAAEIIAEAIANISQDEKNNQINDLGLNLLKKNHEVEWTRKIHPEELSKDKQICHRQPFAYADGAFIETYVAEDDEMTCENIIKDAKRSADDGRNHIEHLFESVGTQRYECILDTGNIADLNEQLYDMKWIRDIKYPCRDDGWSCDEHDLSEYTGGDTCSIDDDCHSNFEAGVCDLQQKTCISGNSKGKQCTSHENCDTMTTFAQGKCVTGKCHSGANKIQGSYIIPSTEQCSFEEHSDKHGNSYASQHKFCGAMSHGTKTVYTGYCVVPQCRHTGKDLKTFVTCKAFENENEKDTVYHKEIDYQNGHPDTHKQNFHLESPPWESLAVCPEENIKSIGGQIFCDTTVDRTDIKLPEIILATSVENAQNICNAKYPKFKTISKLKY